VIETAAAGWVCPECGKALRYGESCTHFGLARAQLEQEHRDLREALGSAHRRAMDLEAKLATDHRRIEHLTARMRYWRTQATGYPDSRQQREARRKG
jgi:hypothetical protein